jgi:outer membrane protein OmpA-like peptidoglycan-associated protein
MFFSLNEAVKEVFSGEVMSKLAGLLGESQANLQKALQAAIPSVLTGIVLKAESSNAHDHFREVTEAAKIEIPFNLNSLAWWWDKKSVGADYKKIIFDEKAHGLSDAIALYAGVSRHSASALVSITAPAALGILGKYLLDTKMNANGLRTLLNSQKRMILNEMPTGIFLEGIFGFENLTGIDQKLLSSEYVGDFEKKPSKWILPIILLVIGMVVAWYFINKPVPAETRAQTLTPAQEVLKDTLAAVPVSESRFTLKLPDGTALIAKKGGLEDQLIQFFNDSNAKPSRRFPYTFDQLSFNKGSTIITNESMGQVLNVAAILKAFPRARIKIGGFNEKGGDSIQNKILSESRARAVAAAIKASGANPNQIAGIDGFGSDFAKYTEDAADSLRGKDNRIAISIRSK